MGLGEALRLYESGERIEAAEEALRAHDDLLGMGHRRNAYNALGAAAKFFYLGGNANRSLECYERLIERFEVDAARAPNVSLVMSWMAKWPEIYSRAAFAAIDCGEVGRAVDLSEAGRCRVTGYRLGPLAAEPPANVPGSLWREYVGQWRQVVARIANDLVDTDKTPDRAIRQLTRKLDDLHGELEDLGAEKNVLRPIGVPAGVQQVMQRLSTCDRATSVLYSIRLFDALRFVRITADGTEAIPLDEKLQAKILDSVDSYVARLRELTGAGLDAEALAHAIAENVDSLVQNVNEPLSSVLRKASDGVARLLWIPHENLAAIPLAACGAPPLVDSTAVITAPSLTMGAMSLGDDKRMPCRTRSVRGFNDDARLDGGDNLLGLLPTRPMEEARPATIAELRESIRAISLVHVTCHGVYDWQNPLVSYLDLGDREKLSVEAILTGLAVDSGTLVLFGTCDSGTIVQSDVNEPIGIPTALLTAGARTVMGSTWPVMKLAALGICAGFLQETARGTPSPEALQRASKWLRNVRLEELQEVLRRAKHPLAEYVPVGDTELQKKINRPSFWASYVHWGGGWRADFDI